MEFHGVDVGTQFKRMRELVPEAYRAFLEFDQKAFKDGAIPGKTKELIALGIAQITQCAWCIQAHTKKAASPAPPTRRSPRRPSWPWPWPPARRGATAGWRCSACRSTRAQRMDLSLTEPQEMLRVRRAQLRRARGAAAHHRGRSSAPSRAWCPSCGARPPRLGWLGHPRAGRVRWQREHAHRRGGPVRGARARARCRARSSARACSAPSP